MTRQQAVKRLFVYWIVIAAIPVVLISVQSISGKYGEDAFAAWSWLLMQISPVLSLLLAAVFGSPSAAWKRAEVDSFKWKCAKGASFAQGIALVVILLVEPILSIDSYMVFDRTGVGLALLQGIVVAAAGAVVFDGR